MNIEQSVISIGQSWVAACTEGLVVFSLEADIIFDPFQLDSNVTPETIQDTSLRGEHTKALLMSLRMNEPQLIYNVMEAVRPCDSKS